MLFVVRPDPLPPPSRRKTHAFEPGFGSFKARFVCFSVFACIFPTWIVGSSHFVPILGEFGLFLEDLG